jgi:hypothetical protein
MLACSFVVRFQVGLASWMTGGGGGAGCWDVVIPVIDTTPIAGGGNAGEGGHGEIW